MRAPSTRVSAGTWGSAVVASICSAASSSTALIPPLPLPKCSAYGPADLRTNQASWKRARSRSGQPRLFSFISTSRLVGPDFQRRSFPPSILTFGVRMRPCPGQGYPQSGLGYFSLLVGIARSFFLSGRDFRYRNRGLRVLGKGTEGYGVQTCALHSSPWLSLPPCVAHVVGFSNISCGAQRAMENKRVFSI